jgi:hypothetical protein
MTRAPSKPPAKPRYCKPRPWGIGEWGSIASIIGIGLWLFDKWKTKPDPDASEPIA